MQVFCVVEKASISNIPCFGSLAQDEARSEKRLILHPGRKKKPFVFLGGGVNLK